MANELIPVVDFSAYRLDRNVPDEAKFPLLITEVYKAFSKIGFVYLVNTGIPSKIVSTFSSPTTADVRCGEHSDYGGITLLFQDSQGGLEAQEHGISEEFLGSLHSVFTYAVQLHQRILEVLARGLQLQVQLSIYILYSKTVLKIQAQEHGISEEFLGSLHSVFTYAVQLHQRILEVLARGLQLQDPMMLVNAHKLIGKEGNVSALRSLFYPPPSDFPTKAGQVRCGEHSDYGGITLLFQDSQGGLEVKNLNGDFVAASPIENAVIVNVGDLMQRWTADKLVSTKHRVLMPFDTEKPNQIRQSMAFFGHPDSEEQIVCIDGSNKYPPVGSLEYLNYRFSVTY
ncbi:probable iron/ascorbate oxidoreductase DDB_G0283291 [Anneissia japonica]|uniref:probable iron/ascorbate oxidoreductase DDB_G0283291 n=1 Tax=Anneissia japonica TaxID=1529436 RepID=UPI001425B0DA|nr:probable iron/ascorbate oxidoreductase DDB_G0283291 [Anneissia japonica]